MQKSRKYIFLIELVPGGKGEGVDTAEITVRAVLMSFSIALTGFGFADFRKAVKRFSVSLESFMSQSG